MVNVLSFSSDELFKFSTNLIPIATNTRKRIENLVPREDGRWRSSPFSSAASLKARHRGSEDHVIGSEKHSIEPGLDDLSSRKQHEVRLRELRSISQCPNLYFHYLSPSILRAHDFGLLTARRAPDGSHCTILQRYPDTMSTVTLDPARRKQILRVLFISLLLDLVRASSLCQTV